MRVLWFTNIPSPYRLEFYSQLGKKIELTVVFERENSDERDKSWNEYHFDNFRGIVLHGIKIGADKALNLNVAHFIKREFDKVIVSNFLTPTGMLAVLLLKVKKIPYYLESDGGFYKKSNLVIVGLKSFFIKGAAGYFSTGEKHDEYYLKYGADPDKIIRYPFTSVKRREVLDECVTEDEKKKIRIGLGIDLDKQVILTVGQFIPRKGIDVLLKALSNVKMPVSTYIIGGIPTREYRELVKGINQVHFLDFMEKDELFEYFKAADLFVLPTKYDIWGLVVNEAMACGLPIVTTDKCLAGLELVENKKNGLIVKAGNPVELATGINEILMNYHLRESMSQQSLQKIREYTIEKMVERHVEILEGQEG